MNMNHVTPTHEESFRKKWENYIPQELHQTFNLMLDVVINEARDGMKSPDVQPQPAKPFDRERFERMFRAVVASGVSNNEFITTEEILEELDAYYAGKKGGNNG